MANVVDFKGKKNELEKVEKTGITYEDFQNEYGSHTNKELLPAYVVTFENTEDFDGKVTNIKKLPKKDSYIDQLSYGTCGLFNYEKETDKITQSIREELSTDIIEVNDGKYELTLVFKEELEGWVFESLLQGKLYFTAL